MSSTRMSGKGQIVIPREVRERHGWGPGTQFAIEEDGNVIVLRPVGTGGPVAIDHLVGCLGYSGPVRSLDEMAEGIARGARRSR